MSVRRRAPAATLIPLLVALVAHPATLSAQTIVGRVLDDARESPIGEVAVRLLDRDGKERASAITDAQGRFTIEPPADGAYYLTAERLGYEPTRSPLLALHTGGSTALDLMMVPQPLGIEGVAVDVEAVASEKLRGMGIDPAGLGQSFVSQEEIEAIQVKKDVGVILEWQHINGLRVVRSENATVGEGGSGGSFRGICISLTRARDSVHGKATCALPVLDGLPIDNERLEYLDPESVATMAVLQPIDARILYGKRGDHGAVLIWTKGRR